MRTTTTFLANVTAGVVLGLLGQASVAADNPADNLVAFIGQKISLERQPRPQCDNCLIMNAHFVATYQV